MRFQKIQSISKLKEIARNIRRLVLISLSEAGSGHTGGSLGLTDVFTSLYFAVMNHDPKNPNWINRDRLILSIGHVTPIHYATLAKAGYFPKEELKTLRKLGSRLQGHPDRDHGLPGLELSAGSLGQGLSVAVGMALSDKIDNKNRTTFCICGDGELQEGSIWEAAMSAAHHSLQNLITIVDRNKLQIDGKTEDVMQLEPLTEKWKAFGWKVLTCDGNNIEELIEVFSFAKKSSKKPTVIIANTIMGKGIKSIEDNYGWHGRVPSKNELELFLKELS